MSSSTELDSDLKLYSIHVACKFGPVEQKSDQRSHPNTYLAQYARSLHVAASIATLLNIYNKDVSDH